MLSKEKIEQAASNILRGNDVESACLIMEEVIWNGLEIKVDRVNIVKVAMRQILNFIDEYKTKDYLDVVREKVQLKEKNNKQANMIDEMVDMISSLDLTINRVAFGGQPRFGCNEEIKQYFREKSGVEDD